MSVADIGVGDSLGTLQVQEERRLSDSRRELVLNMGPQHPSTHGVLRVIVTLDGETIVGTDPILGYLHRGVEKIGETRRYSQFTPWTDRTDYVAAPLNNLGYILAVEKLCGIEAPERAQYWRVSRAELSRIASHLPLSVPQRSMACIAYSEQVGTNRQRVPSRGLIQRL